MKNFSIGLLLLSGITACNLYGGRDIDKIQEVRLQPGSTSIYAWSLSLKDNKSNTEYLLTDTIRVRIFDEPETIQGHERLTRIEAQSLVSKESGTSSAWYKSFPESLIEIAYMNPGVTGHVKPKIVEGALSGDQLPVFIQLDMPFSLSLQLGEKGYAELFYDDTSIRVREEPRLVYQYPLVEGQKWVNFNDPFFSQTQVKGYREIVVEAGHFKAAALKTTIAHGLEWKDYVDEQGLIMREHHFTQTGSSESGSVTGTLFTHERLELIARYSP